MKKITSVIAAAFLAVAIPAQSGPPGYTGPSFCAAPYVVPMNGQLIITAKNVSAFPVTGSYPNDLNIYGIDGSLVYAGIYCDVRPVTIAPRETFSFPWDGVDLNGNLAPPGVYLVEMDVVTTFGPAKYSLGFFTFADDAGPPMALSLEGSADLGTTRRIFLQSPQDAGFGWAFAIAFGRNVGTQTCGGIVPLDFDSLLQYCMRTCNTLVCPLEGVLDFRGSCGLGLGPILTVPNDPALAGIPVYAAFVVMDYEQPCPVRRISAAVPILFGY